MTRRCRLAVVCDEPYFDEFAENCAKNLNCHGFETGVLNNIPRDDFWDVILVVGIHKFTKVPFRTHTMFLGVQTEQLPLDQSHSGRLCRNLARFQAVRGYYRSIFEWNPSLIEARLGGEVLIPYGCVPRVATEYEKKWDVLFIGNVTNGNRRQAMLDFLESRFNFYPDFSPGFGARKDEAINGSKICLNVHYYESRGFESPRVFDYLSRGAFTLTERANSTWPFVVGRDLDDFGDKFELADKLEQYLENDGTRMRIAEQGYLTASAYDFGHTARIIATEIDRMLDVKEGYATRITSWSNARFRSGYMDARDSLSLKRRSILSPLEK